LIGDTAMVDRDLIRRKLADLEQYVQQLAEYVTPEEYRRDWRTQRIVERTLQMSIEACVDVANHVIADRKLRVPGTYAETFDVLAEAGLLEPSLHAVMVRMTGFRNLIVHDYARLDPPRVIQVLGDGLADFDQFRTVAIGWV
jgi:uncharacterized protein YutE (UPF0331/DUF86 family)